MTVGSPVLRRALFAFVPALALFALFRPAARGEVALAAGPLQRRAPGVLGDGPEDAARLVEGEKLAVGHAEIGAVN